MLNNRKRREDTARSKRFTTTSASHLARFIGGNTDFHSNLISAALAGDLNRWLEGRTILARPSTPIEHAWRWTKRNPIVAALSAALLGILVLITLRTNAQKCSAAQG